MERFVNMTWNLRLVEIVAEGCQDERYIEIREVFYDQVGKPLGHTIATMGGADAEEIKQYLTWALEALDKPVLTFKNE
jgi:FPC/CPF motif-containing protein YcgG